MLTYTIRWKALELDAAPQLTHIFLVLLVEFNRYNQLNLVKKDSLAKDLNKIEKRIRFYFRNIDLDPV